MLGNLMNALMQPTSGGGTAGGDMLSSVVGGLMGGSQGGGAPVNQLLSGLSQVMNAKPGASAPAASSPLGGLLGPIANAVAGQVGIPPAVATSVAATAMHYLVSSHPSAGGNGSLTQQLVSGGISPSTMQSSGMVNAVSQATGLSTQQSQQALSAAFNHIQSAAPRSMEAKKQAAADRHAKHDNQ